MGQEDVGGVWTLGVAMGTRRKSDHVSVLCGGLGVTLVPQDVGVREGRQSL